MYTQTASMRNIVKSKHPDLDSLQVEFSALNIRELIISWENKEKNILDIKEGEGGRPRRKSENFVNLSSLFERESIGEARGEAVTGAEQGCDNPAYEPAGLTQNSNLIGNEGVMEGQLGILPESNLIIRPTIEENVRVSCVLRQNRVERRGALSLADIRSQPTNRKRARDTSGEYPGLPGTPTKKVKSDHI